MKFRFLFFLVVFIVSGCSASTQCVFNEKAYKDGASVFLRERQNICLCEEDHWICIPAVGAVQSGQLNPAEEGL
jgi:hypothetical protein